MVGVPKSLGCKTCRQRKLKCDQQKPSCDRCVRTGRQCGGYEKQMLWKNSFSQSPKSKPAVSSSSQSASANPASSVALMIVNEPGDVRPPKEIRAGPSYSLQFLSLFLTSYMPAGEDTTVPSSGKLPLIVWPHRLPDIMGRSEVVDNAVNAMITSYLGMDTYDARLVQESLPLYGVTIRQVYQATTILPDGVTEDILTAIMAMTMFEMFVATGTGWMSHVRGGAALLQHRGPPTPEHPINPDLLRRFRSLFICDCIGRRKYSFFQEPQWQTLNGSHPYDHLLDIMAFIPSLLEIVDKLSKSAVIPDDQDTMAAFNQCLSLEQKMRAWEVALSESFNGIALFWHVPFVEDLDDDPELSNLFPYSVRFKSLRLGQLHQLYWASQNQIYNSMEQLLLIQERIRLSPATSLVHPTPVPVSNTGRTMTEVSTMANYYADLCCAAQGYLCSPEMGAVGRQSTLAAMALIKMYFEFCDTLKYRWCRRELMKLANRGFRAGRLLGEITREGYANLSRGITWMRKANETAGELLGLENENEFMNGIEKRSLPIRAGGMSEQGLDMR